MRFLNRKAELGLNVLQILFLGKPTKLTWNAGELSEQLKESELFLYQVLNELRECGYVQASRGVRGGYTILPGVERRTLKDYCEHFNRWYTESAALGSTHASERANRQILKALTVDLEFIFNGNHSPFTSPERGAA